jgi:hypothetical protein
MPSFTKLLLALLVGIGLPLHAQSASRTPTAHDIIQRYIAARGGIEKMRAIRTLAFRGPPRPNGKPGRQILRARPYYFTIGA